MTPVLAPLADMRLASQNVSPVPILGPSGYCEGQWSSWT